MASKGLTDNEIKELRLYLDSMEKLEKQEPPMYADIQKDTAPTAEWDEWNAKEVELNERYSGVIVKAILVWASTNNMQFNDTGDELITFDIADIIKALLPAPGEPANGFYNVPTSAATDLIQEILGAGKDLQDLPAKKKYIAHGNKYEVTANGNNSYSVSKKNDKAEVSIELADIYKLLGNNKTAKKFFVLTLIKANEQAVFSGNLLKDYVTFPLQELVDIGFYKSTRAARTGFNRGADVLTSLKVKGNEKTGKNTKKATSTDALEVLFTGARIIDNQCYIFLNNRINWAFIAQYFTIIPSYYFKLSNRASDLLYYIFYLARQHTKDIEKKGYFSIGFRAIQSRLNLPSEIGLHDPQRDIKDVIENAIEEIEEENSAYFKNTEFSLLPVCDFEAPIADFLNNGYLKVMLKGKFAETFIQLSKDADKKIEATAKRQARIAEKAQSINLAKAIEKQDNAGEVSPVKYP